MDPASLKAKALEETTRAFLEKQGYVPDPDSDEWEDEYRRQFALVKAGKAGDRPAAETRQPDAPAQADWPELRGPPAETRWAATLRAERLKEIQDKEVRAWLVGSWTAAKDWLETRELSAPAFRRRIEPRYAEHRQQSKARAAALEAERRAKASAAAAIADKIKAAGITARGLIELVDVSTRVKAAPIKAKLAELRADNRHLRVFETTNPAALLIRESGAAGRAEYAIERDAGLVADLKLFAEAAPP